MKALLRLSAASIACSFGSSKNQNRIPHAESAAAARKFPTYPSSTMRSLRCSGSACSPFQVVESEYKPSMSQESSSGGRLQSLEEGIEKAIYGCRFMTFLAVCGSLLGSLLCFLKGCVYVVSAFTEYYVKGGMVTLMLFEAIDIYLIGTVMLVFGMGLYELFISTLDIAKTHKLSHPKQMTSYRSNLFGLFTLMERPQWLEIQSVNELKTRLGHVIVMALLIGLFEKSKKVVMSTSVDLLCFSASVLISSGGLYLLSRLNSEKPKKHA